MKIKVLQAMEATPFLSGAKLTKMESTDKIGLVKAARELKKVADEAESYMRDLAERLKPDDKFSQKYERLMQWQKEGDATTIPERERAELNDYFMAFNKAYEEGVAEKRDEEVNVRYKPLTAEAFNAFADSNDFDVNTYMLLADLLQEADE